MNAEAATRDHAALMDAVYRGQRHIYDWTRKFFLFGRDSLVDGLGCEPGATVLEIGCGTGRNLGKVLQRWPGAEAHGLDISAEMLKSADRLLVGRAMLAHGDATGFDPQGLFGRSEFDRVMISFALSMIPNWQGAIAQGLDVLAPGGSLHIVDFGDFRGLPAPVRWLLEAWLRQFHVSPRADLAEQAAHMAAARRWQCRTRRGPGGYFRIIRITRLTRPN